MDQAILDVLEAYGKSIREIGGTIADIGMATARSLDWIECHLPPNDDSPLWQEQYKIVSSLEALVVHFNSLANELEGKN